MKQKSAPLLLIYFLSRICHSKMLPALNRVAQKRELPKKFLN